MRIKYSPCKSYRDTVIKVIGENTITIDGDDHAFAADSVSWPDIFAETNGAIIEAHREDGELCLTVLRFYSQSCSDWDSGNYHDLSAEAKQAAAQEIIDHLEANGVSHEDAVSAANEVSE